MLDKIKGRLPITAFFSIIFFFTAALPFVLGGIPRMLRAIPVLADAQRIPAELHGFLCVLPASVVSASKKFFLNLLWKYFSIFLYAFL